MMSCERGTRWDDAVLSEDFAQRSCRVQLCSELPESQKLELMARPVRDCAYNTSFSEISGIFPER